MLPEWALWWLRPVSSAARVGEHSAVVWSWLYLSPFRASRSAVGIRTRPPNALDQPKPMSSSRTSRTLGAPSGGGTGLGKSAVESLYVRPILTPGKRYSGRG